MFSPALWPLSNSSKTPSRYQNPCAIITIPPSMGIRLLQFMASDIFLLRHRNIFITVRHIFYHVTDILIASQTFWSPPSQHICHGPLNFNITHSSPSSIPLAFPLIIVGWEECKWLCFEAAWKHECSRYCKNFGSINLEQAALLSRAEMTYKTNETKDLRYVNCASFYHTTHENQIAAVET